jgi:hypothetical protein
MNMFPASTTELLDGVVISTRGAEDAAAIEKKMAAKSAEEYDKPGRFT